MKKSDAIWTTQFEVVNIDPEDDILNGSAGAFVNVYGRFPDAIRFLSGAVSQLASVYGLGTIGIATVKGVLSSDLGDGDESIRELIESLSDERPIVVGTFHAYPEE